MSRTSGSLTRASYAASGGECDPKRFTQQLHALAALAHNATALDAWLAQRLHRVDPARPRLVPWVALKDQFDWHYDRVRKFREVLRRPWRS